MPIEDLFSLALVHAFANNIVLIQLLGVSAFFAFSRDLRQAFEIAVFSAFLLLGVTAISFPLLHWGLHPLGLRALDLVVITVLSACLTRFVVAWCTPRYALTLRRHGSGLYLAGGSSAIIGFGLQTGLSETGYVLTLVAALGTGIGLGLFLIAFAALRDRLEKNDAPAAFRGSPLMLISAGLVAMSLLALQFPD